MNAIQRLRNRIEQCPIWNHAGYQSMDWYVVSPGPQKHPTTGLRWLSSAHSVPGADCVMSCCFNSSANYNSDCGRKSSGRHGAIPSCALTYANLASCVMEIAERCVLPSVCLHLSRSVWGNRQNWSGRKTMGENKNLNKHMGWIFEAGCTSGNTPDWQHGKHLL